MRRITSAVGVAALFVVACSNVDTKPFDHVEVRPVDVDEPTAAPSTVDIVTAARQYALDRRALLGLSDRDDLVVIAKRVGAGGLTHVRMRQVIDGVPVFGSDVVVHGGTDAIRSMNGNVTAGLHVFDVRPVLSQDIAMSAAKHDYVGDAKGTYAFDRESTELVVLPSEQRSAALAWHVVFYTELQNGKDPGLWNYFIDAKTGEILQKWNAIDTLSEASGPGGNAKVSRTWNADLDVEASGSKYAMDTTRLRTTNLNGGTSGQGTIVTGPLNPISDAAIDDAHGFAEATLNMLKDWMGYNSIDNAGFKIISRVHYGNQYENAYWDGTQMTYGDGASTFYPLSGSIDVVAHEIDHGFTSFHSNLTYSGQSGGMNESFSDVAGTIAEWYFYNGGAQANFNLGEQIFKSSTGALRYMCNPTQDGQSIDNAANYTSSLDVHYSSGVFNKAFCNAAKRLATGGTSGNATADSVHRAGKAWFEANANYWTASSTFVQGCKGVLDAATALGYSATEVGALQAAFADVGVSCSPSGGGGGGGGGTNAAPTVSLTAPTSGATVSGNVTVSATAADSDGTVAKVTFSLPDGTTVDDTTAPYSVTWDSTKVADGSGKTISAVATDDKGAKSTASSVTVTVQNTTSGCIGGSFAAADVPQSIPDNNATGITSSINVTGNGAVGSLALSLNITHTYRGDLKVTLIGPDNTQYVVSNRSGGSADNIVLTNQAVTTFNGKAAAGTWKLLVQDLAAVDVGKLNSWSLAFTGDCNGGGSGWSGSATPNLATIDNGTACTSLTVSGTGNASDVKLDIAGSHDYRSILKGTLAHNGTTVSAFPVGTFPAGAGTFSFTNRAVSGLSGSATGTWTFCIVDTDAYGDTGVLTSWSVHN